MPTGWWDLATAVIVFILGFIVWLLDLIFPTALAWAPISILAPTLPVKQQIGVALMLMVAARNIPRDK